MPLSERQIRDCIGRNQLQLILLPTEACNFRCVYCYEDFEHNRMEPTVVRGVKNLLTRRAAELDRLALTWFGGEPLLALDVMEDILCHAGSLARRHPRMRYESDVTTNAYLLSRPVFGRLLELGVTRYQVTFDGSREWHDKKRVLTNGRGTFDRIWENVAAMVEVPRDFTVVVRLHVDRNYRAALPEFLQLYRRTLERDPRFKLCFRIVSQLGGPQDATLPVLGAEEGRKTVKALRRVAEEQDVEQLTERDFRPMCYAAHTNSFVVRANGRLNKCTVALEHPANQVGRLHEDGELEVLESRMQSWIRGLYSGSSEELNCPRRGLVDVCRPAV